MARKDLFGNIMKRSNGLVPAGAVTSGKPRPLAPPSIPTNRARVQDAANFKPRYSRVMAAIDIARQPAE